mmetsp:Transcript_18264/g.18334  ORF Transcript_18264/g.18334 Transcript_18264/m.18334 type:complete len:196 (-) Transcript_18264:392-979(-)|eukprot:CAMPEP_0182428362 /NCGR_PEP_ID=MMETSP1167-20130531/22613_1 /TAXON_ID=2988 /ORGANISM="Mallomonas Sp, Strain CCMP3275" /LENGTH=195 /DNA_ID=CAMNT_0024611225 /DNA_START=213 /DNA_END=800 /DNA_ORIENTATION=+
MADMIDIYGDTGQEENIENASISEDRDNVRRGKWTDEEEVYAVKLMESFKAGQLGSDFVPSENLRSFIARKLECKPMRISKKFPRTSLNDRYIKGNWSEEDLIEHYESLKVFEKAYREKDLIVNRNRLKRKKYYIKDKNAPISKKVKSIEGEPLNADSILQDSGMLQDRLQLVDKELSSIAEDWEFDENLIIADY